MSVDILKISRDAREAKKKYNDVIDASIGMFFDETKNIGGMPSVSKAIRELSNDEVMPYPAVDGGELFKNNLKAWVLGDYQEKLEEKLSIGVCATPGGSGAIAATFSVFTNPGDYIFVSDVRWQYERFAARAKLNIYEHILFDGDTFNIKSFKANLDELAKKQKRIIVIINDPCHNPTGYTLSEEEFSEIIKTMNSKKDNEIIFLYDVAYLEFSHEEDKRAKIGMLEQIDNHITTIIAFSGSKTFGVYGLRMGAAIILDHDQNKVNEIQRKYVNEARGSWSATPTISIELFNHFSIPENKELFLKDLNTINNIVQERSQIFLKESKAIGLKAFPFRSGFYTVIFTRNPKEDYLTLQQHRIYAVPMNGGIRLALCSLSKSEIKGLSKRIKTILEL